MAAASILTTAVYDAEHFAENNPKLARYIDTRAEAVAEAKFAEMSAKDRCYSVLILSVGAGIVAIYGFATHDDYLLASVGAFTAPLLGLISRYCGKLKLSVSAK